MLVITRRPGEKIVIPEAGITITFIRRADDKVRIGIDAPKNLKILRHELSPKEEVRS